MSKKYTPTSVAILGPGAVGSFLAALLWKGGIKVTCIGKDQTVSNLNKNGILIKSNLFGDFKAFPKATTTLTTTPDILFITTKSIGLQEALKRINWSEIKPTVIIPLLNGFEHIESLRKLHNTVIVGSISIEVFKNESDIVMHTSHFAKIRIAFDEKLEEPSLDEIASFLTLSGVETQIGESEAEVIWEKLVRLNAIACTTSATNQPIGYVREDAFWRGELLKIVTEAAAVASAHGEEIAPEKVMNKIDTINPKQFTSMQRDISKNRKSEIDSIAGAIVRAGKKKNIDCPTIEKLIEQIETRIKR